MPGIRISGMASGLPPNIVEQIMEAERIPVKQLEAKKADDDSKLTLVSELETKVGEITKTVSDLVSNRGFANNKLLSGDPNIVDGAVDPEHIVTGDWQVEVLRLAQKPGAMTVGFPDKDQTQVGVGYLRFETPEGRKDVYVNTSNNTLEGIANAINSSGLGLRAQVLNDKRDSDNPFRLLVTGLGTGDDAQVNFPKVYMLDGDRDLYFENSKPAQNAIVKIDGFEMEVPENKLKDVIPGVTLDLKQAAPGRQVNVSVKEDYEKISGKVKEFVDAYNAALTFIQNQHKIGKDKQGRQRIGPLGGDSLVRTTEAALRRVIMNPQRGVDSNIRQVNELGIEFNRNGTLTFSQDKFNKKLGQDPRGVANFLRGDNFAVGFIPTVKREIGNLTNGAFGPLANRKKGLTDKIAATDKRIEQKERQLEKKEDSLRKKFSDLEGKMSGLQQQGAALNGMAAKQG